VAPSKPRVDEELVEKKTVLRGTCPDRQTLGSAWPCCCGPMADCYYHRLRDGAEPPRVPRIDAVFRGPRSEQIQYERQPWSRHASTCYHSLTLAPPTVCRQQIKRDDSLSPSTVLLVDESMLLLVDESMLLSGCWSSRSRTTQGKHMTCATSNSSTCGCPQGDPLCCVNWRGHSSHNACRSTTMSNDAENA
jgi:hypothetical protein